MISTVELETRHVHKSVHLYVYGYKADTWSNPRPGPATTGVLTAANGADNDEAMNGLHTV